MNCSIQFPVKCLYKVESSNFTRNKALVNGGAISYNLYTCTINNSLFRNNSAPYGIDIGSFAFNSVIIKQLQQFDSGFKTKKNQLVIGLIDQEGQIYKAPSNGELYVQSQQLSINGETKVQTRDGLFDFENVEIVGDPGKSDSIYFQSPLIEI